MNVNLLRLVALVAAAHYTLALPQPVALSHGTGHYANSVARPDRFGVLAARSSLAPSVHEDARADIITRSLLSLEAAQPQKVSAPEPVPPTLPVSKPTPPSPPSPGGKLPPAPAPRGLDRVGAAFPQCPPSTPDCTLGAYGPKGDSRHHKSTRDEHNPSLDPQLRRDNNGKEDLPIVPPDLGLGALLTELIAQLKTLYGLLPPVQSLTPVPPISPRQVHNADYSSDGGPNGNPPPAPASAQPQSAKTAEVKEVGPKPTGTS